MVFRVALGAGNGILRQAGGVGILSSEQGLGGGAGRGSDSGNDFESYPSDPLVPPSTHLAKWIANEGVNLPKS